LEQSYYPSDRLYMIFLESRFCEIHTYSEIPLSFARFKFELSDLINPKLCRFP
jgi:hypothetical protein